MGPFPPKSAPPRPDRGGPPGENPWAKAGMALMIPSVLAAGPLAGYLIGRVLTRWTGWGSWLTVVFIFIGMAAGVRQTIQIIRRLS